MPKEKLLFFIGIWLILLSYFIGLPTEIKNYLFIATGLVIIFMSYGSSFKNFKYKKDGSEKIPEPKKEEIRRTVETLEEKVFTPATYSEPDMKVRKIRTERKPRMMPEPEESKSIPRENPMVEENRGEEEDVIVISSDGDK